jgi:hypothetical protein
MKLAIGWLTLALAIFACLIVEQYIRPLHGLNGARVLLVPMLFFYGALTMPVWAMLILAVFSGLIMDLMYLQIVSGQVEIALGWSIVYFVIFGLLAHGFHPAFERGHWWLHTIIAAVGTSLYLALQYAMISFRREGFVFNELVVWRILTPGLIAALFAPLVHLIAVQGGHFIPGGGFSSSRRYRLER